MVRAAGARLRVSVLGTRFVMGASVPGLGRVAVESGIDTVKGR
jgi:hypothetical protein